MGDILKPGLWNMDCMEGMAGFENGFFDLAIVDPPYGGGGARDVESFKPVLSGGGCRLGIQAPRAIRAAV